MLALICLEPTAAFHGINEGVGHGRRQPQDRGGRAGARRAGDTAWLARTRDSSYHSAASEGAGCPSSFTCS